MKKEYRASITFTDNGEYGSNIIYYSDFADLVDFVKSVESGKVEYYDVKVEKLFVLTECGLPVDILPQIRAKI